MVSNTPVVGGRAAMPTAVPCLTCRHSVECARALACACSAKMVVVFSPSSALSRLMVLAFPPASCRARQARGRSRFSTARWSIRTAASQWQIPRATGPGRPERPHRSRRGLQSPHLQPGRAILQANPPVERYEREPDQDCDQNSDCAIYDRVVGERIKRHRFNRDLEPCHACKSRSEAMPCGRRDGQRKPALT